MDRPVCRPATKHFSGPQRLVISPKAEVFEPAAPTGSHKKTTAAIQSTDTSAPTHEYETTREPTAGHSSLRRSPQPTTSPAGLSAIAESRNGNGDPVPRSGNAPAARRPHTRQTTQKTNQVRCRLNAAARGPSSGSTRRYRRAARAPLLERVAATRRRAGFGAGLRCAFFGAAGGGASVTAGISARLLRRAAKAL